MSYRKNETMEQARERWREEKQRQRDRDGVEVTNAKWREWYANNLEHRREYEREGFTNSGPRWAKRQVFLALESGRLSRPNECSNCKEECIPDAHHIDYDKPLEVEWLCTSCHATLHMIARAIV